MKTINEVKEHLIKGGIRKSLILAPNTLIKIEDTPEVGTLALTSNDNNQSWSNNGLDIDSFYLAAGKDEFEIIYTDDTVRPPDSLKIATGTKYRKLPVVIEAFKYGVDNRPEWFCDKVTSNDITTYWGTDLRHPEDYYCEIKTLEGVMRGDCYDYIIKGVNGEIYPCKPDIFEKTYERAE